MCYGEHKDESDIHRNNERQWEFFNGDVGRKWWSAIVALGVVDSEGTNKLVSRIEKLEKEEVDIR